MKAKVFQEALFNAVIQGRKTQFRELVKPQPTSMVSSWDLTPLSIHPNYNDLAGCFYWQSEDGIEYIRPRFKVGETVYLKEPFALYWNPEKKWAMIGYKYGNQQLINLDSSKVDWKDIENERGICDDGYCYIRSMPEWCARHFIKILNVRCGRLQDISDEDCLKEGIKECVMTHCSYEGLYNRTFYSNRLKIKDYSKSEYNNPREAYAALIDSINGCGTWDSNPYVFCYDFELTTN